MLLEKGGFYSERRLCCGGYQQLFVVGEKPAGFDALSDGRTRELTAAAVAAVWGQINRRGRADQTTTVPFNDRIPHMLFECHGRPEWSTTAP